MRILDVIPFGYCSGVLAALKTALEYAKAHHDEEIYLLGMLVHNEDSVALLERLGVHVLDERKGSLQDQLEAIPDEVTVIFSAHGHPSVYEEIAARKRIKTIDTTCKFVLENHHLAQKTYASSDDIVYIGSKGHLESIGFLADLPRVSFYDVKSKTLSIRGNLKSPEVYAQTTLGKDELEMAMEEIAKRYPGARLEKGRCQATTLRQDALIKILSTQEVDTLIVLGSKTSNNSKKLAEIGERYGVRSHLCLNLSEVKSLDLSSSKVIALSSGASTSRECYLEVKDYLSSLS